MQHLKRPFLLLLSLPVLLLAGCGDNMPVNPCENDFDQQQLFSHLYSAVIAPAYIRLQQEVYELEVAGLAFVQDPDQDNLRLLRAEWKDAYLAWQRAEPFCFGPAEDVFLRASLNNFPVNANAVENAVQTGNYNFDNPETFDKGFPALDYLLFGLRETDAEIVAAFAGDTGYSVYLDALLQDMRQRTEQVTQAWTTEGYLDIFLSNTGTAAGSSLSLIINSLNEHYERTKRDRLGIPSGVLTLNLPNPDRVEAFYSGISAELAVAALEASQRFYLSFDEGAGADRTGLDDLLQYVDARKGDRSLDAVIQEQYSRAIEATRAIGDPLSEAVENDNAAVVNAYNEATRQVIHLKTDLPSVLCVAITYVDNPSDTD